MKINLDFKYDKQLNNTLKQELFKQLWINTG